MWPVYHSRPPKAEYVRLDKLITAELAVPRDVLGALSTMGLRLTCPPAYVCSLIKEVGDDRFVLLSPETAHAALLVCSIAVDLLVD